MKLMRGKFITFEGAEGCGKSTHIRLLAQFLRRHGYRVTVLREPGGTRIGEQIRRILLSVKNRGMTPEVEMLLYLAARGQLVKELVLPALKNGTVVLCDRFFDSTLAYQGYGCGLSITTIRASARLVLKGITPDLTILLDLETEEALQRSGRNDRIEKRPVAYHRRVRRGYLALARRSPGRIKVIRVNHGIRETQGEVRRLVADVLGHGRKKMGRTRRSGKSGRLPEERHKEPKG